ncbi:hypothetical protein PIB30_039885, partial [Stylosanthes scabra]|nr:hypothetical protein [Stylosanthes scabra]
MLPPLATSTAAVPVTRRHCRYRCRRLQYEPTRPFLHWICSSLRPSNILCLSDISQYEQFKKEGKLLEMDLNTFFDIFIIALL